VIPQGFLSKSIDNPSAQTVSAPNNSSFSARSSRLLTEEGAQLVPPRGVRSYIASNCAPIWASVTAFLAYVEQVLAKRYGPSPHNSA